MRTAALIALLPALATLVAARPSATAAPEGIQHHHLQHKHHHAVGKVRKTLSFGPAHTHATFESLDLEAQSASTHSLTGEPVYLKDVASKFIADRIGGVLGQDFYIRDDTYTDSSTLVTHVYARQLINGLEVSDGDINLNIDRDGRIISWGNSFHPGSAPSLDISAWTSTSASSETDQMCAELKQLLAMHKAELKDAEGDSGVWALVKTTSEMLFGFGGGAKPARDEHEIQTIRNNIQHIKDHLGALCETKLRSSRGASGFQEDELMSSVEALISLLPRLAPESLDDQTYTVDEFTSVPEQTLAPKHAPAEPPTQRIAGPGLAKAGVVNPVPARLMYTQTSAGEPRLVWKFEVEMKDNWYEAYVDVATGDLLRAVDWASDMSWTPKHDDDLKGGKQKPLPAPKEPEYAYRVFPWGINDPSVGNLTTVLKPWDTVASPLGWHQIPTASNPWSHTKMPGMNITGNMTTFYTTAGNNVIAHEDWEGANNYLSNYRPVNDSMSFVYDYGEPDGLAPREYIDLVVTQLFYTSNMFHDMLYRMGFDEPSGNFQAYNFGKGGQGADPVICNAQDGSGYNNANFMTPPDGQMPRMRMYVWDTATPFRDGDLEAGIVIHEYSHGLSTRLTGGPANSGCLGFGESGGMGEGWGDAMATLIRQIEEHHKFKNGTDVYAMGSWAANRDAGIRNFKYSTNSSTNPSSYKTLNKAEYFGVHAIGEVWAEFLFVMSSRLVEKYGFSPTLFPPLDPSKPNDYYTKTTEESVDAMGRPKPLIPKHGNTLAAHLIIAAMKLQPCRPSFFDARDAIIQADQVLTGGDNACIIWKAFAERGLGSDATVIGKTPWGGGIRNDGFNVPAKVCKATK